MNFRYKIMQFMQGRYGIDTTFYVFFAVSAVLAILNSFLRNTWLQLVIYFIVILAFARILSRNIQKRTRENEIITGWIYKLKQKYDTYRRQKADETHIYKKCPKCKATLRLPRRKGKHKTVCPKCGNNFSVFVIKEKKYY